MTGHMPAPPVDLDEIRACVARHTNAIGPGGDKAWSAQLLVRRVPALLSEVDRLRTTVAELGDLLDQAGAARDRYRRERDEAYVEVRRLLAERDEAQALAARVMTGPAVSRTPDGQWEVRA